MSKVLLIDIGGTNLRYAYSDGDLSSLNDTNKIKLSCIKGFNDILKNLTEGEDVDSLVISVAGPKINGSITMTNRDFSINEKDIQDSFNFKTCHLLNDWESIGHSLAAFDEKDISLIKDGAEFNDNSFFIGPGTGSFLVLAFVIILGFDFLQASANAKMVNLATNFGSICLFIIKGKILWLIAIPMAICNALGGYIGAKLAINKGNKFIRIFFLVVVLGTLFRFAYDVFQGK